MREGWKKERVADLVEALTTTDPRKAPNEVFHYIDVSSVARQYHKITRSTALKGKDAPSRARRRIKKGDVLFATIRPTLQRITVVPEEYDDAVCSTGFFVLRPKPGVLSQFLFYSLFTEEFSNRIESLQRGASYPAVSDSDVKAQKLLIPPVVEQKRIVAILDEAFACIATAVANTEKNLANARELFEGYLRTTFKQEDAGWERTTVGEQITLQRGFDITKKHQNPGNVPVVSSGGIKSSHDTAKAKGPGVVIGRKGSLGTAYYIEEDFWPHDTVLWVKEFGGNNPKLIYYLLRSLDVKGLDSGTANPALNRNTVHPIVISWPKKQLQDRVVDDLDGVFRETARLESIYQRKLAALTELKQSVLQKALSDELTAQFVKEPQEAVA